jgi:vitamin B12 transporter
VPTTTPHPRSPRWTGRVAGRVTPVERGPALFADYAGGFKLPSIYALAYPLIANPALRPERARNVEAGLDWTVRSVRARAAVFETRNADLIDFDPVNFTNVNRSRVDTRGLDAELALPLSRDVSASASLTYLKTSNFVGPPLRSRPNWTGAVRLTWTPTATSHVFADIRAVGSSYDLSVPTGQIPVPNHNEVSVGGGVALMKGVGLDLTLRNLANRRYEDAVGFPNPGRVLRATLRLTR